MKVILCCFFLFTVSCVLAQRDDSSRLTNDYSGLVVNSTGAWIGNPIDDGIEGSVYLYDSWKSYAIVTTRDDDKNLIIKDLNYDTKHNNFVVKVTNDSVYVFNNALIKEVRLNNKIFKEYILKGEKRFLEVVAFNNSFEVLKNYDKVIRKGKLNPLTQVKDTDCYIKKETIYINKGISIAEIKLNKKTFTKLFGKDAKQVRDFINDNSINVKDEKKLQTILNFQNTL